MGLGGSQKVPAVDKSRKVVNQKPASQGRILEGQVYPKAIWQYIEYARTPWNYGIVTISSDSAAWGHCTLGWSQRGTCIQIQHRHVGVGKPLTESDVPWRLQWTACFLVAGKRLWAVAVLTHLHPHPAGSIWGKWKAGKVSGIEPLGTPEGTFCLECDLGRLNILCV